MSLAGCGGAADTADAEGTEAAATGEAAEPVEHGDYITDESGQLAEEIGAEAMSNVNERLASQHEDNGRDIHILIVDSTDGEDSDTAAAAARSETDADAMIFIAVNQQEIAVVGENIDAQEGEGAANAIITAFDNGNFENGMMNGIMATEMHMED
jgi:uncharacterized membrane protein YgcG